MAGFPILAEPPHRLPQAHGEIGDGFEPAQRVLWQPAVVPSAHFRQKQLGVSEDAGQWIVQFVPQDFTEIFFDFRRGSVGAALGGLRHGRFLLSQKPQPALDEAASYGQEFSGAGDEIGGACGKKSADLGLSLGRRDDHQWSERRQARRNLQGLRARGNVAPGSQESGFLQHDDIRGDDGGEIACLFR